MIKKLVTRKMVNFLPYKGVKLTADGKKEAVRMVRAHRIWEVFLTQKLKFNWSDVHEHAETLEHASSPTVLKALYDYLDAPQYCSHGNPIPDEHGHMGKLSTLSLAELNTGDTFEIVRVLDYPELLSYLNKNDIALHNHFTVTNKESFNELWTIKQGDVEHVVSKKIAQMLYVEKQPSK